MNAIVSQFYEKSMWCGQNVMWCGCSSISSECLLRDLINRLWSLDPLHDSFIFNLFLSVFLVIVHLTLLPNPLLCYSKNSRIKVLLRFYGMIIVWKLFIKIFLIIMCIANSHSFFERQLCLLLTYIFDLWVSIKHLMLIIEYKVQKKEENFPLIVVLITILRKVIFKVIYFKCDSSGIAGSGPQSWPSYNSLRRCSLVCHRWVPAKKVKTEIFIKLWCWKKVSNPSLISRWYNFK